MSVIAGTLAAVGMLWGCASIGNPSGGPRDEDPPRFLQANPRPGSVNVNHENPGNINIDFNELVNVKEAFSKVVLSPPGESTPRVSTRGRRVVVNITDTLLPNTTYTIDFGDAIEDNNEANKLSGFAYTFSTGPVLDSLRIAGMVLGAEDMEPQQGVFVGAYISKEDSAFLKMPLQRLARTDEYGRFIIRGLQDTTYRLFALKDLDNDKHYANPEEDIAWFADIIRPTSERIIANDTIRDLYTGAVDTVIQRERTRFLPNNVLLRMYNTGLKPQYLVSYTRPDSTRLEFIFNSPSERRPIVRIANDELYTDPLLAESSVGNDTLKFWLPSDLARRDTLQLALSYPAVDLLTGIETQRADTVKLMKPKEQAKKDDKRKKKKKEEKNEEGEVNDSTPPPPPPTFAITAKGPDTDITRPLSIEVPVPLAQLDTMAFLLEMKPDSVWLPVRAPYRLQPADTLSERRFRIEYPWERGMSYRVSADSLAATDIYGVMSDKLSYEFKTKPEEDLSNLKITLGGLEPGIPAFVQLIASGDKPKYTAPVNNNTVEFKGIDAGKYYVRLYEDFDGNGRYTTGSYRIQKVFGEPVVSEITDTISFEIPDSISITVADTVSVDAPRQSDIAAADSIILSVPDSIAIANPDSIEIPAKDVKIPESPAEYRRPLTDKEMVDSLRNMGYSLVPIETDSIGRDVLIAIQPDYVYYYPKTINVKKNWDVEQTWNVFETALDLQKPIKLKKNKPKTTSRQQTSEEEEEEEEEEFGNPFAPNRNTNNRNTRSSRNRSGNSR